MLGLSGCDFEKDLFQLQDIVTPTDEMLLAELKLRAIMLGTTWREVIVNWLRDHPIQDVQLVTDLMDQVVDLVKGLKAVATEGTGILGVAGACKPGDRLSKSPPLVKVMRGDSEHQVNGQTCVDEQPCDSGTENDHVFGPELAEVGPDVSFGRDVGDIFRGQTCFANRCRQ